MEVYFITPFPETINLLIKNNIAFQGIKKNILSIKVINLRDFTEDPYKKVDDEPYGGGEGMVMMAEPLFKSLDYCLSVIKNKPKIIFPSPRGEKLESKTSFKLSKNSSLIFICGHYKGIDQRVIDKYVDYEISVGDYVLSNGELSSFIIFDTLARLVPGVLNNINSALTDSFVDDLLDAPYFTRPYEIDGLKVPDVLLSGNHQLIAEWKEKEKVKVTKERRPDLYRRYKKK